jgi:amino-acid N-acetyltransferase
MKKTDVAILPAGFEDAAAIFSLIKTYPDELLPRPIGDIVENIDRFLVCKAGKALVGTVSWQILPEIGAPSNPSVEIKSLAIAPSYRRKGIGSLLVQGAIEHIKLLHPAQIVALTFTPGFFKSLGFKEVPKKSLMHKLYAGCINCSKYDSPFTCPEVAMSLELRSKPVRP